MSVTTSAASPTRAPVSATARRYRLAIVDSHPIQYHAPWYRCLARELDLRVYYAHQPAAAEQGTGFNVAFEWDVPLLSGYEYTFLRNRASKPATDRYYGCDTPEIGEHIRNGAYDAVLVSGWNLRTYWQAAAAAREANVAVLVRGDSQLSTPRAAWLRMAKSVVYPRLLRRFDAFLTVGTRNQQYLQRYGATPSQIFAAPHAVDNACFGAAADAARQSPKAVRERFGLPAGAVVFLFAGKFTAKKRPLDLLQALARVARGDCWALFVGDGSLRGEMEPPWPPVP